MASKLSAGMDRALRAYKDAVRRLDAKALQLPVSITGPETLAEWMPGAKKALKKVRKAVDQDVAVARAQIAAVRAGGGSDDASWKRLDDACRRLEAELISPSTLRQRVDEGKRSMMPKIERLIHESVEPRVVQISGRWEAELDPSTYQKLKKDLPAWIHSWTRYVVQNVDWDIEMLRDQLWSPREGDLHSLVPPPQIRNLDIPTVDTTIKFPKVRIDKKAKGIVGGTLTRARSAMYGLLSVAMLAGINLRGDKTVQTGSGEEKQDFVLWLCIAGVGVAAVTLGVIQARSERAQEKERLTDTARQKAEQAIRDTIRVWVDSRWDKVAKDLKILLADRRRELMHWYRAQVIPALARRKSEAAHRGSDADDARRKLPRLQDKERDVKRASDALDTLEQLVTQALPPADDTADEATGPGAEA